MELRLSCTNPSIWKQHFWIPKLILITIQVMILICLALWMIASNMIESKKHFWLQWMNSVLNMSPTGPVFCLFLWVSSDHAQPITGQVTEVTCPVIGWAQPELTPGKRQKTAEALPVTYRWQYNGIPSEQLVKIYYNLHFCSTKHVSPPCSVLYAIAGDYHGVVFTRYGWDR